MVEMLIVQGIGALAFGALALSYTRKEKSQILLMQIMAYVLFAAHYYLLDGLSGTLCNIIGLVALITIYIFDRFKLKYKRVVVTLFAVLLLIVNIIMFQNIFSIFPLIASIIAILSFIENNENFIRIVGGASAICWLIYAIVYSSYVSIICQSIVLLSIVISLIKYLSHKKEKMLRRND